jgi:putative DNA primase/helicase
VNASEIAMALGEARREGRNWRCRCPLHGGHSLVIRDGDGGRVLATCWAGCDRLNPLSELRRRGLLSRWLNYGPRITPPPRCHDDAQRRARALNLWRDTQRGAGTIVARYLESRSIALDRWPLSLRFHPRCPRPKDKAGNFVSPMPAMVAVVEHVERGLVAVHCTFLRPDGSGKAAVEKPKAKFGPVAGGAVRFGMPGAEEWLAVAEGVETLRVRALRPPHFGYEAR